MLTINPVNYYGYNYAVHNRQLQKNQNVSFKQSKDVVIISRNSMKIIDNIFGKMIEAKEELKNMVINKNGFQVTHKNTHPINPEMRKYDQATDTLIRLEEAVNGTALGVKIDRFGSEEKLRFIIQIEDLKDNNNNVLLRRGTMSEFRWNENYNNRSEEIDKIDEIIEKFLK